MKSNILSAVIVVSCLAGNSQAAGLFSDDQGMHIPDQRLPVYFAYRAGTAPVDYPATAYDNHAARSYQPVSSSYLGIRGGGCADCAGLWSDYQPCKGHGHRGCGARCWGGHGLKAFGFTGGYKARGCGCSSPCGCNVYGYRSYACAPKCGHGFGWNWKRACGLVAGRGCGCGTAPKCGHGFGWHWKRTCGLAGCGCNTAPKCGCNGGCKKGCGHVFKSFWSGLGRCCGVNSCGVSRCGASRCGASSCGCAGNVYGNGEVVPQEMQDYAPTPKSIEATPGELPAPPKDARRGAGRTWQQASALFPSLPVPQN